MVLFTHRALPVHSTLGDLFHTSRPQQCQTFSTEHLSFYWYKLKLCKIVNYYVDLIKLCKSVNYSVDLISKIPIFF